jgi:hypothetical protein
MLRRVAVVRAADSEERCTSIIRVTRIGELGTTLAVTSNRRKLQKEKLKSYTDIHAGSRIQISEQRQLMVLGRAATVIFDRKVDELELLSYMKRRQDFSSVTLPLQRTDLRSFVESMEFPHVRFEVLTSVAMKNAVFWVMTP